MWYQTHQLYSKKLTSSSRITPHETTTTIPAPVTSHSFHRTSNFSHFVTTEITSIMVSCVMAISDSEQSHHSKILSYDTYTPGDISIIYREKSRVSRICAIKCKLGFPCPSYRSWFTVIHGLNCGGRILCCVLLLKGESTILTGVIPVELFSVSIVRLWILSPSSPHSEILLLSFTSAVSCVIAMDVEQQLLRTLVFKNVYVLICGVTMWQVFA